MKAAPPVFLPATDYRLPSTCFSGVDGGAGVVGAELVAVALGEHVDEFVVEVVVAARNLRPDALVVHLARAVDVFAQALVEVGGVAPLAHLHLVVELDLGDEQAREAARLVVVALLLLRDLDGEVHVHRAVAARAAQRRDGLLGLGGRRRERLGVRELGLPAGGGRVLRRRRERRLGRRGERRLGRRLGRRLRPVRGLGLALRLGRCGLGLEARGLRLEGGLRARGLFGARLFVSRLFTPRLFVP